MRYFIIVLNISFFILNANAQVTWGPGKDVDSISYGKNYPRIVTDRSGDPIVIWNFNSKVMFARWNGSGFASPIALNAGNVQVAGGNWMGPDIAASGDTIYVVYKEKPENTSGTPIRIVRSYDGGITFSSPVQVDNIADSLSRFPTVTTDDFGNPVVAFMKFDPGFGNPRWVVARSVDHGQTFSRDILASGWSSPTTEACDCCPGALAASGNKIAMMYRDNDSNIRDGWVGVSNDTGKTFVGGMSFNQRSWNLNACPSSGPDGFIKGDTLYAVDMNGASGTDFVFFSKTSLSSMSNNLGAKVVGSFPGLSFQNFPRIDHNKWNAAMVWKQYASNNGMIAFLFTTDFRTGFTASYDTVAMGNIDHADVAIKGNKIYVVWADNATGTVRYRIGTFPYMTGTNTTGEQPETFSLYPNPADDVVHIFWNQVGTEFKFVNLYDLTGKRVGQHTFTGQNFALHTEGLSQGVYMVSISSSYGDNSIMKKLIIR